MKNYILSLVLFAVIGSSLATSLESITFKGSNLKAGGFRIMKGGKLTMMHGLRVRSPGGKFSLSFYLDFTTPEKSAVTRKEKAHVGTKEVKVQSIALMSKRLSYVHIKNPSCKCHQTSTDSEYHRDLFECSCDATINSKSAKEKRYYIMPVVQWTDETGKPKKRTSIIKDVFVEFTPKH